MTNPCGIFEQLWFCWIVWFRNLPRHQFGNLQSKMFPAYFSMVGVCCAVSVASFGYLHPWKTSSTTERYQLGFLLSSFAFNLTNLFVFTPMTIEVKKYSISVYLFICIVLASKPTQSLKVGWMVRKEGKGERSGSIYLADLKLTN